MKISENQAALSEGINRRQKKRPGIMPGLRRLMFEHCRNGLFVTDAANRFGQHT